MSFNDFLNKVFESKQFATAVTIMAALIWLISGVSAFFPIPDATLRSQWMFGYLFGLLFVSMSTWIVSGIIKFLCTKSPIIDSFVERHWGKIK